MKQTLPFLLSLTIALPAIGQNDVDKGARDASSAAMQTGVPADTIPDGWTRSGIININMTQVNLTNWAAGGFSSVSGIAMFNGAANWKKGRKAWDNSLVLAFGGQHVHNGTAPQKTDDRIELNSKYGYELKKNLYLAGVFQFRTQFTEGFNADGLRISNFMAPAYALLGVGLDYRPNDNFTVFFSPATARMVIVNDKKLFEGLGPDDRVYGVQNGNTSELEMGGYLRLQYKRELAKNITFLTRGDLFSNYLRNPQNIDVTWETLWTFKVNEWFAATLNTLLIYDHDTQLPKVDDAGIPYTGPATQFKQTLGIGLSFKL
ncbi:MAG: DUF3078 domain-containing protein [Flavobacteriales bacterium]|nr:DUF3078 domain-containing protein [Flavobacteriales bacterium]MCB9178788.1 DUF3078 domain-containing protein [Flavobacteriales bacterium]